MTETVADAPPQLLLPSHPLALAHDALGRALAALANARDIDWVSAAAGEYRSEIAEVEVRVRRLMVAVDHCQDDWQRVRSIARALGQL